MKLRNKVLETLTTRILDEYNSNIEEFKLEAPSLIKKLQITQRDPHVEQMINSFAIIHASYEYKEQILANEQITSILFNILKLKLYPPCGKLLANITKEDNYMVAQNTVIYDGDNCFKVDVDAYINHIEIKEKKIEAIDNRLHFIIQLKVTNKKIKKINFFTTQQVISALFFNIPKKKIIIQNRKEYSTTAMARWTPPKTIQEAICFPQKFTMFTIEDIDIVGINDIFEICIPIEKPDDILHYPLTTNEILVTNEFNDVTDNISFQEDTLQYHINLTNKEVIDIKKVYVVTEEETIELPRCTLDIDGWYTIVRDDQMYIGFEKIDSQFLYFYCEISCINRNLYHEQPEFEEYAPIDLSWPQYTNKVERNIYKTHLTTATALLNMSIDNIDHHIINLIKTYDKFALINIKLDTIEKLPKILTYGNFQVVHNGYCVTISTTSDNLLLLYGMMEEIRYRLKCFIHFIIKTPNGTINDSRHRVNI